MISIYSYKLKQFLLCPLGVLQLQVYPGPGPIKLLLDISYLAPAVSNQLKIKQRVLIQVLPSVTSTQHHAGMAFGKITKIKRYNISRTPRHGRLVLVWIEGRREDLLKMAYHLQKYCPAYLKGLQQTFLQITPLEELCLLYPPNHKLFKYNRDLFQTLLYPYPKQSALF